GLERELGEVRIPLPRGRARIAREVLLLERARQEAPHPERAARVRRLDDGSARALHLREELADGLVDADVAAHDERLAVQARLEAAEAVARRPVLLAPHDLERDPPPDPLPEAALDRACGRAHDEESRPPARRPERLERELQDGHTAEREEGGHDARA